MLPAIVAWTVALLFALTIGASGTAASMASAYGGGAIKRSWVALLLVGSSALLGANLGGGAVVTTMSQGIIAPRILSVEVTIIILAAACLTLILANVLSVPLSTSEVTVGAVIGVGVAYRSLFIGKILIIFAVWIVLPVLAFAIAYLLGKRVPTIDRKLQALHRPAAVRRGLTLFLIGAGSYEAFSAGMNNVANAIGPLIGAGLSNTRAGVLWGSLFVAIGAIFFGHKVLQTTAKKITKLSLLQGSIVSMTAGSLVIIASLFGLPVPLTQATTMAIFGIGSARDGTTLWKQGIVKKIVRVWIVSPVSAMVVSYTLVETIVFGNVYALVAVASAFVVAVGYLNLARSSKGVIGYQSPLVTRSISVDNDG